MIKFKRLRKICAGGGLLVLLACNNVVDSAAVKKAAEPVKELKIQKLAFDLKPDQAVIPGANVRLYAKANQVENVSYDWQVPGTWVDITGNLIEWTVPEEAGEYTIKVTAVNTNGDSATNSTVVNVLDAHAYSAPQACSFTINSNTRFSNKSMGTLENSTVTRIDMLSNGSVRTTVTANGETTTSIMADDTLTQFDEAGDKKAVMKSSDLAGNFDPALFNLSNLMMVMPDYTQKNDVYRFSKTSGSVNFSIEYDNKYGQIRSLKKSDSESGDFENLEIEYQLVDGYLFPAKMNYEIVCWIAGIKNSNKIEQEFTDVIIGDFLVEED